MKKTGCFILLLCFMAFSVKSQDRFRFGIESGGGVSRLYGKALNAEFKVQPGFTGGFTFQYDLNKVFSVKTGIYYDRKNALENVPVQNLDSLATMGTLSVARGFDYLTLPLLFRAGFGEKTKVFINTGPYVGLLLGSRVRFSAIHDLPPMQFDNPDIYKSVDLGLSVGVGISYPVQRWVVSAEARGNAGFINVFKTYHTDLWSATLNTANLVLGVAYKLDRKKVAGPAPK
jgi:hypothetical protein